MTNVVIFPVIPRPVPATCAKSARVGEPDLTRLSEAYREALKWRRERIRREFQASEGFAF